jgi:hypothetical protein
MFTRARRRNRWLTLLVAASLLLAGLRPPATLVWAKDRKPIVVSFGQPNIWSLEQAHYLLARMHMTNLELQAKMLTDKELDPNATNGTRIQILKQLLEINGQFDQGVGFQNRRIVENMRFNDSRRRELITRRDANRAEATNLRREIARLEVDRARLDNDPSATPEAKALNKVQIDKKNEELTALKEQISQDDDEFKTLAAEPSGTPTSPTAVATPGSLPTSVLDKLVEKNVQDLFKDTQDARLNATTMLDNTVQLQYEIIAKQLTLLRDEVGPGERLIFLELPQSIYSTPGSGDEKMAQTWWHVNGYTRTDPLVRLLLELFEIESKWSKIKDIKAFTKKQEIIDSVRNCEEIAPSILNQMHSDPILDVFVGLKCERQSARRAVLTKLYREANSLFARVEQNGARNTTELIEAIRKVISVGETAQVVAKEPGREALLSIQQVEVNRRQRAEKIKRLLLDMLSEDEPMTSERLAELRSEYNIQDGTEFERGIEFISLDPTAETKNAARDIQRRTVRTVDIIPRQSSLNVNDIQETVKSTGILAAFKFLFGFAGQVNFQRQREQYEQFVHQELYASGFGKGSRDFGWTFGALPGTKRVAPGVRTTFAALVVPNDAESVVVSARGCYFPRNKYQPLDFEDTGHGDWSDPGDFRRYNCGDEQKYILAVPGGGETSNFWVTNVDYQDGKKDGEFVTVSVRGNNFSSQMGVLVDGVPLFASVGLAQPHLTPKRAAPAPAEGQQATATAAFDCAGVPDGICGRYERIDSDQIVFSFRMPKNYVGTPTLTLIAPGKAVDLNSIGLRINSKANVNLRDDAAFMFGRRPGTALSLVDLQLLNNVAGGPSLVILTGTGFDSANDKVYVDGVELTAATAKKFRSANLYELQFILPPRDSLEVTIVQGTRTVSKTFSNPPGLKIDNATVLSYEAAANNTPAIMNVKLEGSGFTNQLRPVVDGAAPQSRLVNISSREAIVRIVSPETVVVIALEDMHTHGRSPGIVVQRPKP